MSVLEPRRWVDLDRAPGWDLNDWLDTLAVDAYEQRRNEEEAAEECRLAALAVAFRCTICGRPASDDICPRCSHPAIGPALYEEQR